MRKATLAALAAVMFAACPVGADESLQSNIINEEKTQPFGVVCPYCNSENLEKGERVGICNNCLARWVDGIWYTKSEWETKFDEKLNEVKIKRLKSYGWTDKRIARVLEGYIYIGDTSEIVREAWGGPEDINRTITAYGTDEQWVYGLGNYVYFRNGKVTVISD